MGVGDQEWEDIYGYKYGWKYVWKALASMRGLRELRMKIIGIIYYEDDWKIDEAAWMEKIRAFQHLDSFELDLPIPTLWLSNDFDAGSCHVITEPFEI